MTEPELTALATDYLIAPKSAAGALAEGYLALLAERNALKAHVKPLGDEMIRALRLMNREQLIDWIQNERSYADDE